MSNTGVSSSLGGCRQERPTAPAGTTVIITHSRVAHAPGSLAGANWTKRVPQGTCPGGGVTGPAPYEGAATRPEGGMVPPAPVSGGRGPALRGLTAVPARPRPCRAAAGPAAGPTPPPAV